MNINLKSKTKRVSFTIIEVLVIISMLATLGVNSYGKVTKYFDKPKDLEIARDLKQYQDAITCLIPTNKPFTEENINKNLDSSLRFSGGLSKTENPYGNKYKLEENGPNSVTVVSEGKNGDPDKQNVVNVSKSDGSSVINNATKYDKTNTIKNLARSLGFVILDKSTEEAQPYYDDMYKNFTKNTKNIIDRIAGKKQSGASNYDVTPAELKTFGNELTSAITDLSNDGQFLFKKEYNWNVPTGDLNYGYWPSKYETFNFASGDFQIDTFYLYFPKIILTDGSIMPYQYASHNTLPSFIKFNTDGSFEFYRNVAGNVGSKIAGPYQSFDIKYSYNSGTGLFFHCYPDSTLINYYYKISGDPSKLSNVSHFELQIGDEIVQEPPVINVGQMNTSKLISDLQSSEALNSKGALTQQFISNYSKEPSSIYNNPEIKIIVAELEK